MNENTSQAFFIPESQIQFHPMSYADPSGRVFRWQGELYRGVAVEKTQLYRRLFEEGIAPALIQNGILSGADITPFRTQTYSLVLKLHLIPFPSYIFEWCPDMLKDAALMILDLELALLEKGLTLIDVQPGNVLFNFARPVYIDYGSISEAPADSPWIPYAQFRRFYFYPLFMMSRGGYGVAQRLLHDHSPRLSEADLLTVLQPARMPLRSRLHSLRNRGAPWIKQRTPDWLHPFLRKGNAALKQTAYTASIGRQSRIDVIQGLRNQIEQITFQRIKTDWSEYDGDYPDLTLQDQWDDKHKSAYEALCRSKPKTVLDIASNRGWFSQIAARQGAQVVAFDIDEPSISKLYRDLRGTDTTILPLVMDFENPSPAEGICYQWMPAATERYRCEMVLAIALVHHLVFKAFLPFEQIAAGLSSFTEKTLLVEFIPHDDIHVSRWWNESYAWYTLENFQAALRNHFSQIEILPSAPHPRIYLLCER
jgi:SAM-dependent methyltransferase